jgi:NAD(P)-dependent dehydrogenase (short-subunit alcohol dehydrogenase family)
VELNGKMALVTGGAVRIGAAICRRLAREGCGVVVHCLRSDAQARALAAEIEAAGVRAFVVRGALGRGADPERLLDEAWDAAGRLDALVNNAALFFRRPLERAAAADVREEIEVNLVAPLLLARRFVGRARAAGPRAGGGPRLGAIVNLLDRRVATNEAGCLPYLAAKKGLLAFTESAALEWAPAFTVNAVAPGAVLPPPGKGPEHLREAAGPAPLRVACTPEDVADAVALLLRSDTMTGQTLFVDGGQHLGMQGVPAGEAGP